SIIYRHGFICTPFAQGPFFNSKIVIINNNLFILMIDSPKNRMQSYKYFTDNLATYLIFKIVSCTLECFEDFYIFNDCDTKAVTITSFMKRTINISFNGF